MRCVDVTVFAEATVSTVTRGKAFGAIPRATSSREIVAPGYTSAYAAHIALLSRHETHMRLRWRGAGGAFRCEAGVAEASYVCENTKLLGDAEMFEVSRYEASYACGSC